MSDSRGSIDKDELRDLVNQKTRYKILRYIMAHPKKLPSLEELTWAISKGKSTIHGHLDDLIEANIVDKYKLPSGERQRDLPSTFYGLTEFGIATADRFNLFENASSYSELYAAADKPDHVQRYEGAPRPEKKTQSETESELEDLLTEIRDHSNEDNVPALARDATSLTTALSYQSGETHAAEKDQIAAFASRLIDAFHEDSSKRAQIFDGFRDFAPAAPLAIAPLLPTFCEYLEDNDDVTHAIIEIVEAVVDTAPDRVDDAVITELATLDLEAIANSEDPVPLLTSLKTIFEACDQPGPLARTHFLLGDYYKSQLNFEDNVDTTAREDAATNLEQASEVYEQLEDYEAAADTLTKLADLEYETRNFQPAINHWNNCIELYQQADATTSLFRALNNLGHLYVKAEKLAQAKETYERAGSLSSEIEDKKLIGTYRQNRAYLEHARENTETAIEHINAAIDAFNELDDPAELVDAYEAKAELNRELENHDAVENALGKAIELEDTIDESPKLANLYQLRAHHRVQRGAFETAIDDFQHALDQYDSLGQDENVAEVKGEIASLQTEIGDFTESETLAREGAELYDELGQQANHIDTLLTLAQAYRHQEEWKQAQAVLDRIHSQLPVESIDDDARSSRLLAKTYIESAKLKQEEDHHEKAIEGLKKAKSASEEIENDGLRLQVQTALADSFIALDQFDQARSALKEISLNNPNVVATIKIRLSNLAYEQDETERGIDQAQEALELVQESEVNSFVTATVHRQIAQGHRMQDDFADAQAHLLEAIELLEDGDVPLMTCIAIQSLVATYAEAGKEAEALQWSQSGLEYYKEHIDSQHQEVKYFFKQKLAELQSASDGVKHWLELGLWNIEADDIEQAATPLQEAWSVREEVDKDSETFSTAVSAGVARAACTHFTAFEEAAQIREQLLNELDAYTDSMRYPAKLLYQFLTTGEAAGDQLHEKVAWEQDDASELEQLEASAFHSLLEELLASDDDTEYDPSRDLLDHQSESIESMALNGGIQWPDRVAV